MFRPTADLVRGLVGGSEVSPVEEGGEHSTWWVGERHVLRLTLDPDAAERQRQEIALRDTIRPYLSTQLPRSVDSGEWAPRLSYTLDTRLPGVSAERQPISVAGEQDLTVFLRELRTLPIRGLIHNDLKGEHLLITPDGRLSGVIDWADAIIGDLAEDVAGLVLSVGGMAAVRIALDAGYDLELCVRGLGIARWDTEIRLATPGDSPLWLLRRQRDRAYEITPLDRPGSPPPRPGSRP
ncbi:aminoglycoside phosphotransferase family protein [Pseudonocardiaceae bacterium YIM PH 21723]|nr:aminoglycoside phosphotransferase family protein [Pseudonocardiaceae bacterium YIM PH 21723]